MKFLKDLNVKNKTVLLRVDINSDVVNGKLISGERIFEASKTIKYLQKKGAKVVVIAHQGNPGKSDFLSLRSHAKQLNKYTKISFEKTVYGNSALKKIKKLKPSEALLLENLRFEKDEFLPNKKNNKILNSLVPLIDFYVNDAFSVCHRNHTSIASFPKHLPSAPGLLLEKELYALKKINLKNTLYILGGAKPESNIKLLKGNKVLAGGLFGQICLISKGKNLGFQNKYLKKEALTKSSYDNLLKKLKSKQKNIITPIDFAVNINSKRKEFNLSDFPIDSRIDDIGKNTINLFIKEIKQAKSIYVKGPMGYTGDLKFQKGTFEILKAVANSKSFSVVGGGHLSDSIKKSKIPKKKFNHISLSGGALLNFIAGEKLIGLKALGYYKN